jgi:hypothetical protein
MTEQLKSNAMIIKKTETYMIWQMLSYVKIVNGIFWFLYGEILIFVLTIVKLCIVLCCILFM